MTSLVDFLTDSVLRGPTIGSMLMCIATALVGVILLIRKETLLGEALSHAAYPGIVGSALFASLIFKTPGADEGMSVILGAFLSASLGLFLISFLQKKVSLHSDAALCMILSLFFGVGVLLASRLQVTHAVWYKQISLYLYGQAATLVDRDMAIYAVLVLITALCVFFLYRFVQWIYFDRAFAKSVGASVRKVEFLVHFLLILSIVIGMRSVGVVLLSGMLIAPAVAARRWTSRLSMLFFLAALIGGGSAFLGNYLSVNLPLLFHRESLALPTGPMIVLVGAAISLFSLFFSLESGLIFRAYRMRAFKNRCLLENVLKRLWKEGEKREFSFSEIVHFNQLSSLSGSLLFFKMRCQGWLQRKGKGSYRLSSDGWRRASRTVRLHRLWEVYLVDYLGQHADRVHRSAEEIEHLLSYELERELTRLLKDPKKDPHKQPIPNDHESLLG